MPDPNRILSMAIIDVGNADKAAICVAYSNVRIHSRGIWWSCREREPKLAA